MSTPLKKGLGDYVKGKKFTLKSGNDPAFKMMGNIEAGDSPITNEFGIGKGVSPYKEEDGGGGEKGAGWKKAAGIFLAGINNVYGNPNEKAALSSDRLKKTDEEEAHEKVDKETLNQAQRIIAEHKRSKIKTV